MCYLTVRAMVSNYEFVSHEIESGRVLFFIQTYFGSNIVKLPSSKTVKVF